jgi:hypothetical protein
LSTIDLKINKECSDFELHQERALISAELKMTRHLQFFISLGSFEQEEIKAFIQLI